MSCSTCDCTMQAVGEGLFWCARCGTLRGPADGAVSVPALVSRVKEFREAADGGRGLTLADALLWQRLGVEESVNRPGERRRPG